MNNSEWRAVRSRDASSDGRFVYAVASTGIYCRPSCPSRRPARAQVSFFSNPADARREGYRPCRRCRPDAPISAADDVVGRAIRALSGCGDARLTLGDLSARVGCGRSQLRRAFVRSLGITPRGYVDLQRFSRFKSGLRRGGSVTSAIQRAGYGSTSRVYERTAARLGMTPTAYRGGAAGVRIRYAIVSCPFGRLLVGATDRGLCAVSLSGSDRALVSSLRREHPKAELSADDRRLGACVRAILRHVVLGAPSPALPLDVRGTAFEWKVWKALRRIPRGATRTYGEVAREIGSPSASRAVARACAANSVALVIPCHRAIRKGGGLAGYRWGVRRKRAILAAERPTSR